VTKPEKSGNADDSSARYDSIIQTHQRLSFWRRDSSGDALPFVTTTPCPCYSVGEKAAQTSAGKASTANVTLKIIRVYIALGAKYKQQLV